MDSKIIAVIGVVAVVIIAAAAVVMTSDDSDEDTDYTLEVSEKMHGDGVAPSQTYSVKKYIMDNSGKMTELGTVSYLPKGSEQIATIMISAESGADNVKWTYNADTKEFTGICNNIKCILKIDISGCENVNFKLSSDENPMLGFHYTGDVNLNLDFGYSIIV